jgi:RNA polymerase sigma-70 factor (ECF subfamily)
MAEQEHQWEVPMNKGFQDIYDEFNGRIRFYLSQLVGEDEAEDLTQEVFIKVHRGLGSFRGESSLSTWIYRIATNSGLDTLRSAWNRRINHGVSLSQGTEPPTIELSGQYDFSPEREQSAPQQMIKFEMKECIREFVDKLPPDYRAVIVLSELKSLKNKEIADILGINLNNVKIRLHRARAALKKEFQTGCDLYHDEAGFSCARKKKEASRGT